MIFYRVMSLFFAFLAVGNAYLGMMERGMLWLIASLICGVMIELKELSAKKCK